MFVNSNNNSVDFGAMKKSQFKGLDLVCVNALKAPIEKFNSNLDLQNWASKQLTKDAFQNNLTGKTVFSTDARNTVFDSWIKSMSDTVSVTKAAALVIMKSLFGDLKSKTDAVAPVFNKKSFENTLKSIDGKTSFNFKKEYLENLQKNLLKDGESLENGWMKISSKKTDPNNFDLNVERLKMFSNGTWCTKSLKAEEYLKKGDFYILYDNHKPVVGIRTENGKILEIQGQKNNSEIPLKYFDEVSSYINKEGLNKDIVRNLLDYAREKQYAIEDYQKSFAREISNNDGLGVLDRMGMYVTTNKDGEQVLSKLRNLEFDMCLGDLGIDENKTFENIVRINDDACFVNSTATKLPKLQVVVGDLDLRNSNIKDISSLKEVFGDVDIRGSQLCEEDFKNVKIHGSIKRRKTLDEMR